MDSTTTQYNGTSQTIQYDYTMSTDASGMGNGLYLIPDKETYICKI